jgi:hypothetical protein
MIREVVAVLAFGTLSVAAHAHATEPARHAGRVHSLLPSSGVLIIEEAGVDGEAELLEVEARNARVVRVWRDAAEPSRWREQPVRLYALPAGTFVVVIGHSVGDDHIVAHRIEVPAEHPHQ